MSSQQNKVDKASDDTLGMIGLVFLIIFMVVLLMLLSDAQMGTHFIDSVEQNIWQTLGW